MEKKIANTVKNAYFYDTINDHGNHVVVGINYSEAKGNGNALIIKFDKDLNIVATENYDETDYSYFYNVAVDDDGNYITVGDIGSGTQDNNNILIAKFDKDLNKLASKIYSIYNNGSLSSIAIDKDGNYVAIGYMTLKDKKCDSALIVKFDKDLNILSDKIYNGNGNSCFYDIEIDSNNDYIIVGYDQLKNKNNYYDGLIVKFDSNLNKLSAKTYGGDYADIFNSIAIDYDGNYIIVGSTGSEGPGNNSASIIKFDKNLNVLIAKIYGGNGIDYFHSIVIDDDGNYITVGYTDGKDQIVKFDKDLNVLTTKICDKSYDSHFYDINADTKKNYIIINNDDNDATIFKVNCLFPESNMVNPECILTDSNLPLVNSDMPSFSIANN